MAHDDGSSCHTVDVDLSVPGLRTLVTQLKQCFDALSHDFHRIIDLLGNTDPLVEHLRLRGGPPTRRASPLLIKCLGEAIGLYSRSLFLIPSLMKPMIPHSPYHHHHNLGMDGKIETWVVGEPRYNPYPRTHYSHRSDSYKLKFDILSFDGHMHMEDFLDWLQSVKMFFEYMDIPNEK